MEKEKIDKPRLFVDMDGTLAVFQPVDTLEKLYEPGYFLNLTPQMNVVEAVHMLQLRDDVEVYVLSAVLSDSQYAKKEKNEWLDIYLPDVDAEHRIFVPCGDDKTWYVPGKLLENDVLLDDYTLNLNDWEPPARGLKLLNGINGTKGTWQKSRISIEHPAEELADMIAGYLIAGRHLEDERPQEKNQEQRISYDRMTEIADAAIDLLMQEDAVDHFEALDAALEMFCYITRTQMFLDGNKRVAQLMCNKIMMENDIGILSIPYDEIDQFKEKLVDYYETNDTDLLKDFLRERCLLLSPTFEKRLQEEGIVDDSLEPEIDERAPRM